MYCILIKHSITNNIDIYGIRAKGSISPSSLKFGQSLLPKISAAPSPFLLNYVPFNRSIFTIKYHHPYYYVRNQKPSKVSNFHPRPLPDVTPTIARTTVTKNISIPQKATAQLLKSHISEQNVEKIQCFR